MQIIIGELTDSESKYGVEWKKRNIEKSVERKRTTS